MKYDRIRQTLWTTEYDSLKGIHLEYREEIPPVVNVFHTLVQQQTEPSAYKTILDIGCGKGRVGIHLAKLGYQVVGMDFVMSVLKEFRKTAASYRLNQQVFLLKQDLNERWNVEDHSIDVVFTITVMDNLISFEQQQHFKRELLRVLRPQGLFVLELYLPEDGYYGQLLQTSPDKEHGILVDPNNQIQFKMYSPEELLGLFGDDFTVLLERERFSESVKYDQRYERKLKIVIFEKKQHKNLTQSSFGSNC